MVHKVNVDLQPNLWVFCIHIIHNGLVMFVSWALIQYKDVILPVQEIPLWR